MPPFLISFLLQFKTQIIVAIVIVGVIVGAWFYHIAAVEAEHIRTANERNTYWTDYIKSAPKETLKVEIKLPAPPPKVITVRDTTIDSTALAIAQAKLDSIARENFMLSELLAPFKKVIRASFTDSLKWAQHDITVDPWGRTISDSLHYNPASIIGIQVNNLVPVPFKRLALHGTIGGDKALVIGAAYRLGTDKAFDSPWNNYCIGLGYQVAGPIANKNWYTPIKITITGFID